MMKAGIYKAIPPRTEIAVNDYQPPLLAKQGKKIIRAWPVNRFLMDEIKRMEDVEQLKRVFGS